MASEEQKRLADIVKSLHSKLRKSLRLANGDYVSVWKEHCCDKESLESYAAAMSTLAVTHWSQESPLSRVNWCYDVSLEYFRNGGLMKMIEKQRKRLKYAGQNSLCCCCFEDTECSTCATVVFPSIEIKLITLDVGSCFNPFREFKEFETVAVDLEPASSTVYKCDFLNLEVIEKCHKQREGAVSFVQGKPQECLSEKYSWNLSESKVGAKTSISSEDVCNLHTRQTLGVLQFSNLEPFLKDKEIASLPKESFHVVVFSLLLSYFPSPNQRWQCCVKAHQLLASNGLLLIVTPDSSHQNRNSQMVKSWKNALESIGFVRWRYVKQTHLHCMGFRKISKCHFHGCETVGSPNMMFIPQDSQEDDVVEEVQVPRTDEENQNMCDMFDALPGDDVF